MIDEVKETAIADEAPQFEEALQDDPGTQTSPVPEENDTAKSEEQMSFDKAMKLIIEGKKVRRLGDFKDDEYACLKDAWLTIHREGVDHRWLVGDGDMLATDWVEINESN